MARYAGGVVSNIMAPARSRRAVVAGSGRHGGRVKGVDLRLTVGDETERSGATVRASWPKPEEDAAVVVKDIRDAKRRKSALIEGYGAVDVATVMNTGSSMTVPCEDQMI